MKKYLELLVVGCFKINVNISNEMHLLHSLCNFKINGPLKTNKVALKQFVQFEHNVGF